MNILLFAFWCVLLVAPSASTFSSIHGWDVSPHSLLLVNLWAIGVAWWLGGRRWFFLLTFPLALFGTFVVAADLLRNVNLLELMLSGANNLAEGFAALAPYALAMSLATLALLALALWPVFAGSPARASSPPWEKGRVARAGLLAAGVALGAFWPAAFIRAWPINILTLGVAKASGRNDIVATALQYAAVDPRDRAATWQAGRIQTRDGQRETYVLVIGESVRADRLRACGGPQNIAVTDPAALVYCDVTAGSSSTYISVPLLISRESPGGMVRVSQDATFLKAFEQVGFQTYWLSVQEPQVAWPDAQHARYIPAARTDRAALTAPLHELLQTPGDKKVIVVHAYNAHFDYCDRFAPADALIPVDCVKLRGIPTLQTRPQWLNAYDNAVHESMRFVDQVIAQLSAQQGEVFMVYTPDHGENLLDDERQLLQHALTFPTLWDSRVPAVVWANPRWRERNPQQWRQLQANQREHLTHGDVVPTLLGAAGIEYVEPRAHVADLTRRAPPPRVRWVHRSLGDAVDGDQL